MSVDTGERAAVSIGPKSHGRHPILDSMITPSVSYRRIRAIDPRSSQRPRPSASSTLSLLAQQNFAYMDFVRQQLFDWNERGAAATEYNNRMTELVVASMATGQIPTLPPPPPPPGAQPLLPTFEQFMAEHYGTPGTGGSSTGGGATYGSTPESQSPVTPVWRGGGGGGSASGGGGGSASGDDLGFGYLGFGGGSDGA